MINLFILLIVIGLTLGPIGQVALTHPITPNLLVVFLWAIAWFRTRESALQAAITGGVLLDLAGFSYFGLWTISTVAIVLIIIALKSRYLDSASLTHALVVLAIVSFIPLVIFSAVTKSLDITEILFAILGNVILGGVVYYLIAMRLKLFSRWAGRRIG